MTRKSLAKGGEFLLTEAQGMPLSTPEDFTSEHRQIAETTEAFVKNEILPDLERLEEQDFTLLVEKLRACADLGLFLVDIPEEEGGLELDKVTSMLVAEKIGPSGSFAITSSGQTGIGSLPLVYYGTSAQKQKYLPKLTSGEWIAAYCLTEPDCGSDPLSARTIATLSDDGSCYLLNGVKQFITNAAFADLFTVFAKIDGQQFTAFLVERDRAGLSIGNEEKKMGLKGTSTAQVVLDNVRVPVENLLGEVGKGHKIAFNVLNIGRLKLSATVVGAAKSAFAEAAGYAVERKQFGQPLAGFGAIREKLADMSATLFCAESLLYRVAGLLDERIATLDRTSEDYYRDYQLAIEEYAAECAIAKVFCTNSLALIADEALQIHGGYGYIRDYPIERFYRDERINRIFEGTNEINRLLIPNLLLRRATGGTLNLKQGIVAAKTGEGSKNLSDHSRFAPEFQLLSGQKKVLLLLLDAAEKHLHQQEVLLALGDLIIGIFAFESALLRADKAFSTASSLRQQTLEGLIKTVSFTAVSNFQITANRCAAYTGSALQQTITQHCNYPVTGLLDAKQHLAEVATESGVYPF